MSQRTLFKNDLLRIAEDYGEPGGDVLWIADDLDETEVSLSREQLAEIMPVLQTWLDAVPTKAAPKSKVKSAGYSFCRTRSKTDVR